MIIVTGNMRFWGKMKEFWCYLGTSFDGTEKIMKKIKKTEKLRDYEVYVKAMFDTLE